MSGGRLPEALFMVFLLDSKAVQKCANKSQDQVDDGNVEAENRPAPKKRAEPKKATKKVAMKEPKKKATPGGK